MLLIKLVISVTSIYFHISFDPCGVNFVDKDDMTTFSFELNKKKLNEKSDVMMKTIRNIMDFRKRMTRQRCSGWTN